MEVDDRPRAPQSTRVWAPRPICTGGASPHRVSAKVLSGKDLDRLIDDDEQNEANSMSREMLFYERSLAFPSPHPWDHEEVADRCWTFWKERRLIDDLFLSAL